MNVEMSTEPYFAHEAFRRARLSGMSRRQCLFFTAWCCDRLWVDLDEPYLALIGAERAAIFRDAYRDLWDGLMTSLPIPAERFGALPPILEGLADEHGSYSIALDSSEQESTFSCYYHLMRCAADVTDQGAFHAGAVLAELADFHCNGDMTSVLFRDEVRRQRDMIEWLSSHATFDAASRFLYREDSPFWRNQ